ncbi:Thioesterase superfamily protein [Elusimicrobium minutum Pei191]|uniref:Thioesterase superfamily protein n=1 Tax=Elusimicrobium minutum (strain Pei191) TaxID=445932 RepID=B2KEP6_ELUMP|nr:thioesterase family protein [Elusimicrobium minutum]ACC98992.1 Thioesterase superfamily protein [Elusimicrobium minutum Pei191]
MHAIKVKIYYHDTDCGNVVYYANYLKYFEMARTEYIASKGFDLKNLMEKGIFFVVARQEVEYKYPALYQDELSVETKLLEISPIKIVFENIITNQNGKITTKGKTTLVCVNKMGVPTYMPKEVSDALGA